MMDFGSKLSMITMGIQTLYQGAISLGTAFLKPNADMEQTRVAFVSLLGSSKAADAELRDLAKFAADTPFEFPDLANSVQQLIAFQIPLKNTKPLLTAIGDALSGLGRNTAATLDQVVRVFGQMNSAGKIMTGDLQQLTQVGINGFQLLADQMHKPVSVIRDMVSRGMIPATKGIELLRQGMEKTFGGGMQAQSKTFLGLLSTFQDNIGAAWRAFTGPLFDKAKAGLTQMGDIVSGPEFQAFATGAGKAVGDALTAIGQAASNVVGFIQNFGKSLDAVSKNGAVANFKYLGEQFAYVFDILNGMGKSAFAQFSSSLTNLEGPTSTANILVRRFGDAFWDIGQAVHNFGTFLSGLNVSGFLSDMSKAGSSLSSEFGPSLLRIANLIQGDFGRQLKDAGKLVQEFGRFFTTSIVPALKDAEPGFLNYAHVIVDTVIPAMFKIRSIVMDVVEHAFKVFGPIVERIIPPLIRFAGIIYNGLAEGMKFIMPYVLQATQAIGKFATEIMDRVAPIVSQWIDQLMKNIDTFSKIWAVIWPGLSQVLAGVWDEIVGVVKIAWALVSGIVKIGLDLLSGNWAQAWTDFKDMLSGVWDGIKTYLAGAWKIIGGIFTIAWAAIQAIWAPVGAWFQDRWNEISRVFGNIGGWFHDRWSDAWNGVTGAFGAVGQWFQDRWRDIQNVFGGIGAWFATKFAELNAPFVGIETFVGQVFQTIWNIITALIGRAVAWLSGKWNEVVLIAHVYWSYLQALVGMYIQQASDKVHQVIDPMIAWLSSKWQEISTNASNLWTGIKQRIVDIWNGAVAFVSDKAKWLGDQLSQKWESIKSTASGAWKFISDTASQWWGNITKFIGEKADGLKKLILKPFEQARDAIGGVIKSFVNNGLIAWLNNGISAAEGFVNKFVDGLVSVATAVGAKTDLKHVTFERIAKYATGTSGHPGGPAVLGDGDGPELTMANGKPYLFGMRGPVLIPDLPAGSTVLPAEKTRQLLTGGAFSGIPAYANGIGDIGSQIWDWVAGGAQSVIENMMKTFHISAPRLPGKLNDMASGVLSHVKDWALSWVTKILPDFSSGGQAGGGDFGTPISGNLRSWILAGMALTHAPMNWFDALATIAMHESGGNPSSINLWDSNAKAGIPSQGLFQTIPPTFNAYAVAGHHNILSGIDNTAAAIGYIRSRYGSVFNVPGIMALAAGKPYVGYKNGGWLTEPIIGKGLRTGTNYSFVEDGRPEYVTPAGYMPKGTRAMASGGGAQPIIQVTVNVPPATLNVDGNRLAQTLMPSIVSQVRYGVGSVGF
jgi:tape measure domain-containing protein